MRLTTGDITATPGPAGRDGGVVVDIPVELLVAAGFGTPSRHVQGRVRVQILGYLDGSISASAVVHDRKQVEAEKRADAEAVKGVV